MKYKNWLILPEPRRTAKDDFTKIWGKPGRPPGSKSKIKNGVKVKKNGKPLKKVKKMSDDEANKQLVKMMTACGIPKARQARFLQISIQSLNNNFAHELENGEVSANMQVANALFNKAIEGDVRAQIFWLESKAGFQKVTHLDVTSNAAADMSATEKGQRLAALFRESPEIMAKFKNAGPLPEKKMEGVIDIDQTQKQLSTTE